MWRCLRRFKEFGLDAANSTSFTETPLPAPASGEFNTRAPNNIATAHIKNALNDASRMLRTAEPELTYDELDDVQKKLEAMTNLVRQQKIKHLMIHIKDRISGLSHPQATDFGKRFVEEMEAHDIRVRIDEKLRCNATYTSYSYAAKNRGFVNEVALNPERIDDPDEFIVSVAHEYIHGFQKHASPALHHSPFNPETRVVIHPADWIMLEAMCERDAFTKQAFITALLTEKNPDLHDQGLITPNEFNDVMASSPNLAYGMVSVALDSLSRPVDRAHPRGKNYIEHYQSVAIKNYSAGMWNRREEGEKDLLFVRLDLEDLWQVGNYGVGPNSFGENTIEPLISTRFKLSPELQEAYDEMCAEYEIPPLDRCMTLREYTISVGNTPRSNAQQAPALAYA